MKNRRISFLSVSFALILAVQATYGMGKVREWVDKLTNQPPVTVTNAPPAPPAPVPEPVPPVVAPPSTGPTLTACSWGKFPMVNVRYTGTDGWPTKVVAGKTCIGILELNGRKVEWFKPGQTAISVKNAINDPKYFQNIPKGSVVTINIADVNGKNDSNKMTLVWP